MADLEKREELEEDRKDVGGYYAWAEADRVEGKRRDGFGKRKKRYTRKRDRDGSKSRSSKEGDRDCNPNRRGKWKEFW
jgi:hypothetical protein